MSLPKKEFLCVCEQPHGEGRSSSAAAVLLARRERERSREKARGAIKCLCGHPRSNVARSWVQLGKEHKGVKTGGLWETDLMVLFIGTATDHTVPKI